MYALERRKIILANPGADDGVAPANPSAGRDRVLVLLVHTRESYSSGQSSHGPDRLSELVPPPPRARVTGTTQGRTSNSRGRMIAQRGQPGAPHAAPPALGLPGTLCHHHVVATRSHSLSRIIKYSLSCFSHTEKQSGVFVFKLDIPLARIPIH